MPERGADSKACAVALTRERVKMFKIFNNRTLKEIVGENINIQMVTEFLKLSLFYDRIQEVSKREANKPSPPKDYISLINNRKERLQ